MTEAGACGAGAGLRRDSALRELSRLALDVLNATTHEEGLLGNVVELPLGEALEPLDGLLHGHSGALAAGELLRRVGVLRKEALDPPRPAEQHLVLFRQ